MKIATRPTPGRRRPAWLTWTVAYRVAVLLLLCIAIQQASAARSEASAAYSAADEARMSASSAADDAEEAKTSADEAKEAAQARK